MSRAEPLSDQEITEIQQRVERAKGPTWVGSFSNDWSNQYVEDGSALIKEVDRLRQELADTQTLVKLLCSSPNPHGSESFQRVRDQINPQARALLFKILGEV